MTQWPVYLSGWTLSAPRQHPDKGIRSLRGQTATSWTAQLCS